MRTFDVYKHPTQGYKAVKRGFSWPAFLFGMIWAIFNKLFGHVLVLFTISLVFYNLLPTEGSVAIALKGTFQFGLSLLFGFVGNDWKVSNLKKRGYEHIQALKAETSDAALAYDPYSIR